MENLSELSKEELLEMIGKLKEGRGSLMGRKGMLLGMMREGRFSGLELSKKMSSECGVEVSVRNISSILNGIKNHGVEFGKDSKGRYFIEKDIEGDIVNKR